MAISRTDGCNTKWLTRRVYADCPMEERNHIEMQAIAALEHIGSLVLFLVDESESCGTPYEEQMHLLEEVKALLPDTELMLVTSKADLLNPRPSMWDEVLDAERSWREDEAQGAPELPLLFDPRGRVCLSATENVGLDAMRLEIVRKVKAARQPIRWNYPRVGTVKARDHIVSKATIPNPSMPFLRTSRANSETAKYRSSTTPSLMMWQSL